MIRRELTETAATPVGEMRSIATRQLPNELISNCLTKPVSKAHLNTWGSATWTTSNRNEGANFLSAQEPF